LNLEICFNTDFLPGGLGDLGCKLSDLRTARVLWKVMGRGNKNYHLPNAMIVYKHQVRE